MATHCHVLLALWDGAPAEPGGCGTAEAVGFVLEGSYIGAPPFDAEGDGAVIHIATPRLKRDVDLDIAAKLIEEREGALRETLVRTDAFNADCQSVPLESGSSMGAVYEQADRLSLRFQTRYLRTMWALSLFCVLLVMAFALR